MTHTLVLLSILVFIAPIAYQRIHFHLKPRDFDNPQLRAKTGLQIHHGHWGLIFIIISAALMSFGIRNAFLILLFWYGCGLLCDEIIPSLMMPSKGREIELEIYAKSRNGTLLLVGIVVLILCVIASTA